MPAGTLFHIAFRIEACCYGASLLVTDDTLLRSESLDILITSRVSRRRHEIYAYIGHSRVCVCVCPWTSIY